MPSSTRHSSSRLLSLEALRAMAALLVVLFHLSTIMSLKAGVVVLGGLFGRGASGVDLFFVLSGFIIVHVHSHDVGQPGRFGNYIFNRLTRILPAFWIMTLFAGGVYAAGFGGAEKATKLSIDNLVASFMLLPQSGPALLNVSWTLKYEMFFYLMFGLAILNRRIGMLALAAWQITILGVAIFWSTDTLSLAAYYINPLCLEFSLGMASAWFLKSPISGATTISQPLQWLILAAGATLFMAGVIPSKQIDHEWAESACAAGSALLIVGCVLLECADYLRVPQWLARIGTASYSIYLVHYSVITLLTVGMIRLHVRLNSLTFILVATIAVCAGFAFDRLLDQPAQRLLKTRVKPALLSGKSEPTIPSGAISENAKEPASNSTHASPCPISQPFLLEPPPDALPRPQPHRHPRQRRSRLHVRLAAIPRPVRQLDPERVDRRLQATTEDLLQA